MTTKRDGIELARAEAEAARRVHRRGTQDRWTGREQSDEGGQVYSLRIPAGRLAQLREVADRLGSKPSVLMREWVLERLDQIVAAPTDAPPGRPYDHAHMMVDVSDLLRLVTENGVPAAAALRPYASLSERVSTRVGAEPPAPAASAVSVTEAAMSIDVAIVRSSYSG